MVHQSVLLIDGWRIEVESHRIVRDGVEVKLEPRSMELLAYLIERQGQVVSRAEIEEQVWHGRIVSYEALSSSVAKLRKAFGDTGKNHRIIETIPKSGYRLISPISRAVPEPESDFETLENNSQRARNRKVILYSTLLVTITICFAWWQPWNQWIAKRLPDNPSIAVLPFTNMSSDPEQEYFADGMTDDLITDLSRISNIFVISRNSTFFYKDKPVKIRQIAEDLGVRYVVEGSVQRADNRLRINAQLIDATSGGHIWAERYDGYFDDVFSMRDQITREITSALSVTLIDKELQVLHRGETENVEAYDALLRGRAYYQLFTPEDLVKAIPFLEKALELDPAFGSAHAISAAVYWAILNNDWVEISGLSNEHCVTKLIHHLSRALQNPTPLAHRIAARQHEYFMRWDEALSEAKKAIELNPNDPSGYQAMSALQVNMGNAAEGLKYIKKAIRLDPQSDYLWRLGYAQYHLELYDEAAITLQRATTRNPDFDWNYLLLAAAYGHLGREREARHTLATFNDIRINKLGKKRPYTLSDLDQWSIKNESGLKRLREGMRKAGVPER